MSFGDNNKVDFDMELLEEQEETDQTSSNIAEIPNLIKECAMQCLNYVVNKWHTSTIVNLICSCFTGNE